MREINIGDKYYLLEQDHHHTLELTVVKIEEKNDVRLIFFTSENEGDFWNGAYSVDEANIGKFIFTTKEEAINSYNK